MKKSRKIMMVFICIVAILSLVACKSKEQETRIDNGNANNESDKMLNYTEGGAVAYNEFYETELKYIEATLNEDIAYSLDYNLQLPCGNGEYIKKLESLSGITAAGLFYGYPYVSAESLGVENKEEARLATQFAIWRLAQAEGVDDAKTLEYIFDMDNISPYDGYEEYLNRVKDAAQKIVSKAIETPYYANPAFDIDGSDSKIKLIDNNQMIVGPYTLDGRGYNITSLKVSLEGEYKSAVLCDVNGNEKTSFMNKKEVYIKLPQDIGDITFRLRVDTEGNHYAGVVYGTGVDEDRKQNFCVWEKYNDELDAIMDINLPKVTGAIQVKITDNNTTLSGITIKLKDKLGNELEVLESDENGVVLFDNLLVGEYVIEQVCDDDTHIVMDIPVRVTVQYNDIKEIVLNNSLH